MLSSALPFTHQAHTFITNYLHQLIHQFWKEATVIAGYTLLHFLFNSRICLKFCLLILFFADNAVYWQ